jgi:phage terminase large subunit GpA-like protein
MQFFQGPQRAPGRAQELRDRAGDVRPHALRGEQEEIEMAKCEQCGNDYDKSFEITMRDQTHTFDSFECAISALAPVCSHCQCRIVGHGMEVNGRYFCCAHCAQATGVHQLRDRIG